MSDFIIDNMRWSYSRLLAFQNCPYAWYLQYHEDEEPNSNFFAQFGGFVHKILEKHYKGELSFFEMLEYYETNFKKEVTLTPFSKAIYNKYYKDGLEYFESFSDKENCKVLGVEKEVKFNIDNNRFIGYIDLLLKEDNNLIVVDHKSFNVEYNKNLTLSKKSKDVIDKYSIQMYLYSTAVYNEYGKFPDYIEWNFFRNKLSHRIKFNKDDYDKSIEWVKNKIDEIKSESLFLPNCDKSNSFYCTNLCGFSDKCEYI